MKSLKVALVALATSVALVGCKAGDGIITVNDKPIYKSDYKKIEKQIMTQPQFAYMSEQLKDPNSVFSLIMKDKISNELVIKEIIAQEMDKREIKATAEDLKKYEEELTEKIGGKDKLAQFLKENNVSRKQFEKDMAEEIKIGKLVESVEKINITEADCKKYYDANKKQFNYPDRVRASHILIEANEDKVRQDVVAQDKFGKLDAAAVEAKVKEKMDAQKKIAEEVRTKAVNNQADFAKLAKEYSTDTMSAARGGDLGFFAREHMVPEFSEAAFNLKVNTVSEVVKTNFGYHVIIVTDRARAGIQPFMAVKDEIEAYLIQSKKVEIMQKLFEGLKANAKVVYNDKQYDPAAIKAQMQKTLSEQAKAQKEALKKEEPKKEEVKK
ncbi:peptidylprolyl isomerase [bacterium]|nr:peptidylprolyl isomerase [bacterium]